MIYHLKNRFARRAFIVAVSPVVYAALVAVHIAQGLADWLCAAGIGAMYVWRDCRSDLREMNAETRAAWRSRDLD